MGILSSKTIDWLSNTSLLIEVSFSVASNRFPSHNFGTFNVGQKRSPAAIDGTQENNGAANPYFSPKHLIPVFGIVKLP